jgi:two-component system phosphate regulon response regulator OmpR
MQNIIARRVEVASGPEEVSFGPFTFHPVRGELWAGGDAIKLTEIERNLLRHFALHPGAAVDREELARLAGHDSERAVDVQINRLRRKIETDPANPAFLQTVRGRGYIFYTD